MIIIIIIIINNKEIFYHTLNGTNESFCGLKSTFSQLFSKSAH